MFIILCDHNKNRIDLPDSNSADSPRLRQPWHRRKKSLLTIGAILAFSAVCIVAVVSLKLQEQASANAVSFACGTSSGNTYFNVTASVDLSDGMNQQEALLVANTVYAEVSMARRQRQPLSLDFEAAESDNGVWTVKFRVVYSFRQYVSIVHSPPAFSESFDAIINPFDLTVTYGY